MSDPGELSEEIRCPDCRSEVDARFPGKTKVSRTAVLMIHWEHQPMHPNQVGSAHRRSARKAYAAWEALNPCRLFPRGES